MATSSGPIPTTVIGGRHHGMSFAPTNGLAAKQRVETQIVEARERQAAAEREAKRWKRTSRGKTK